MTTPFAIEGVPPALTIVSPVENLLLCLVLNELLIIGIWNLAEEDMLLEDVAKWMDDHSPKWINKPLFDCPMCMASYHGSWFWVLSQGLPATLNDFLWMAVYILALSGLGKLVVANLLQQE